MRSLATMKPSNNGGRQKGLHRTFTIALPVLIAVFVSQGRSASAGLVTYDFAGSITSTTQFNASLPTGLTVGDTYTGSFTFEDSTPAGNPGAPYGYDYHLNALTDLTVHIGSITYSLSNILRHYSGGSQNTVVVAPKIPYTGGNLSDQFNANGYSYDYSNASHHLYTVLSFSLYDVEPNPDALVSNSLVGLNLDLSKFVAIHSINFEDSDINSLTGADNSRLAFTGSVTSLQLEAVPEPSSIVMLGLGALGILGYGWRRHVGRDSAPALTCSSKAS